MRCRQRPKQVISLLVPFGGKDPWRLLVWSWLSRYWRHHLTGYEIIVGRDRKSTKRWHRRHPRPFSKAVAVNNAFKRSHGDIIAIVDADAYLDYAVVMHWAERLRAQRDAGVRSWAIPYRYLLRLTEAATQALLATNPSEPFQFPVPPPAKDVEGSEGSAWGHVYGALIQVMPREAFVTVGGMDERFVGWGGEDRAFLLALETLWGPYQNSPNHVYHLWHPKIIAAEGIDAHGKRSEIRAWPGQVRIRSNDWLSGPYDMAAGNPEKMRALVDSARD